MNGLNPIVECGWRQAALDFAKVVYPARSKAEIYSVSDALYLETLCANGTETTATPSAIESIDASSNGRLRVLADKLDAARSAARRRITAATTTFFVNAATGSDKNSGTSRSQALQSLEEAVSRSREPTSVRPVAIVLTAGQTHRIAATVELSPSDSDLSVVADPEAAPGTPMPTLSGAQPLKLDGAWEQLPERSSYLSAEKSSGDSSSRWTVLNATNAVYGATPSPAGPVINVTRVGNASACQAICEKTSGCSVFTWHDSTWPLEYKDTCWIRLDGIWSPVPERDHVAGHRLEPRNAWKAKVSLASGGQLPPGDIQAIFVAGGAGGQGTGVERRGIRARFPNADPERTVFPTGWLPTHDDIAVWQAPEVDYGSEVISVDMSKWGVYPGEFQNFYMGIGGECERFDPPQSYWCQPNGRVANSTYWVRSPPALNVSKSAMPNLPYTEDPRGASGAVLNFWRSGHWFTLMDRVVGTAPAPSNFGPGGVSFQLAQMANQGAEGDSNPKEFYIEGVVDELDSADEFVLLDGTLYYRPNQTDGAPDASTAFEAIPLRRLVHMQGTFGEAKPSTFFPDRQSQVRQFGQPVSNVSFVGIRVTGAGPSYVDSPHQTATGGDWGVSKEGAFYLEGTEGVSMEHCFFERVDGNAVFVYDHNRDFYVSDSEFAWIGESAVVLQGVLDGPDGRAGTQPRGTTVERMLCRQVGIFEKQSSCFFQSASLLSTVKDSVLFESPRALINQEDQIGGGHLYDSNVLFKSCTQSQDHSAFNSWGRVPGITDLAPPSPPPLDLDAASMVEQVKRERGLVAPSEAGSAIPQFSVANNNYIVAGGFAGSEVGANGGAFDNDDGSSYYLMHNTTSVLGGVKQDFDGHGMIHVGGLYLASYVYGPKCVGYMSVPEKHPDNSTLWDLGYLNATCVLANPTDAYLDIGGGCDLSKPGDLALQLGGNKIMVEGSNPVIKVCGKTFKWDEWQQTGVDVGSSVDEAPTPEEAVAMLRAHLHLPASS